MKRQIFKTESMTPADVAVAFRAHALHVLTVTGAGIARIVAFMDTDVFAAFGLPPALDRTAP